MSFIFIFNPFFLFCLSFFFFSNRQPPFNPQFWANSQDKLLELTQQQQQQQDHFNRHVGLLINRGWNFFEHEYGFCNLQNLQAINKQNVQNLNSNGYNVYNNQFVNDEQRTNSLNSRNPFVCCHENLNNLSIVNHRLSNYCWQTNDLNCYEMDNNNANNCGENIENHNVSTDNSPENGENCSVENSSGVHSDNSEQFYERENEKGSWYYSPSTTTTTTTTIVTPQINAQRFPKEASAWVNFSNL